MKLSHAETQALISARLDGPLDPVAERELNAHLATCESCRAFNASASNLARGLQSLPYLPASPAVTRAVLDHVSTPRSPWSWIPAALPANALPAATAIAAAVIVVFVGSFIAFRLLDADEEPSTLPASTLTVTDLAQGIAETAVATEADDTVEGQSAVTEETVPAERNPATEPADSSDASTLEDGATEPAETGPGDPATEADTDVIGPPTTTETGDAQQAQLATEAPATEPVPAPTEIPAPTEEPTTAPLPTSSSSLRAMLGLETAVPTEEPTAEPSSTAQPTQEPTATDEPTATPTAEPTPEPTEVPTATPTEEPTATATAEPTAEPTATATEEPTATAEPTEESSALGDDLEIVGPPDSSTAEPSLEPTSEPTSLPTEEPIAEPTEPATKLPIVEPPTGSAAEPTDEPTEEPTPVPTDVPTEEPPPTEEPKPTEEPEPTDEPAPTEEQEATVVPIEQRGDETPVEPDEEEDLDDGPAPDDQATAEPDDSADTDQTIIDSDGTDTDTDAGEASPEDVSIIQDTGDDGPEQVIVPAGGDDTDTPDDENVPVDDNDDDGDPGQDGPGEDPGDDGGSESLASADIYASIGDVPGDPGARLGLSAEGSLIFSSSPGRVSLDQDGISLTTGDGPTGQVVAACDANGDCFDISSVSAASDGLTDTPIGWLGGEVIYERLNGDEFAVEFRAIALDPTSLQPIEDRLIAGGDSDLTTLIRPYPVDGALLVPAPAGWLRITSASVEIVDGDPFGGDLNLIRINQTAGQISYVSGGSLILASLGSPGSPSVQLSFAGSDYTVSPDGGRIAVVTGGGIEIWDTSGNVLTTYPSDGIALGSLTWLPDGLVVVDLSNGVLRIVSP